MAFTNLSIYRKIFILITLLTSFNGNTSELIGTTKLVKPSIVAVGTLLKTRSPPVIFSGTGFVVGNGLSVLTNAHVIRPILAENETHVVLTGQGNDYQVREAKIIENNRSHDLALLKITGAPLPALKIGDSRDAQEGQSLAFTGYPLAMGLGLFPATHRATLAAIVPIAQPTPTSRQLNAATINRVRSGAFTIFQLDGTAYPGNSGSPLYDEKSGEVLGIMNMVFIKGTKESAITNPSGISYAIPSQYIKELLNKND